MLTRRYRGPVAVPNRVKNVRVGAFTAEERQGVEVEVAQFLGDVVRLVKPHLVVVTGAGKGEAAREIDQALAENVALGLDGRLVVFEQDEAQALSCSEKLSDRVEVVHGTCWHYPFPERIAVAFVDGPYTTRILDIERLANFMAPRGLLFLHDTGMMSREEMRRVVHFVRGKFNTVEFPTARGLAALQPRGNLWSHTGAL